MSERKGLRLPTVSVFGLLDKMDFSRPLTPEEERSREIVEKRLATLGKIETPAKNQQTPPKKP